MNKFLWSDDEVVVIDNKPKTKIRLKGGPGSGHHGHSGRPGKVGGALPGKGSSIPPHVKKIMDYVKQRVEETDIMQIMVDNGYEGSLEELESGWSFQQDTVDTLSDCAVCIRVPEDVLDKILADGRFKNQFESGTSGGFFNPVYRAEAEYDYFGINYEDMDPTIRPVYGYMSDTLDALDSNMSQYGPIVIKLKDTVRDRTTVTGFDSLNKRSIGAPASPLNDPSWKSMIDFQYDDSTLINAKEPSNNDRAEYIEAQIHGGVSVDDIDTIYFYPPSYYGATHASTIANNIRQRQGDISTKYPNINVVVFDDYLKAIGYDIY